MGTCIVDKATDYINSLSSNEMQVYARDYWKWLQDGQPFPEPEQPGTLLDSEAQSVRVALADCAPDDTDDYALRQYDLTNTVGVDSFEDWLRRA